ncbi:SDR family NAD(P)-dependent oxidoreductase [Streptomyces sp. N2-109]|uniref:SDR family NAD(P)-dependent oxidoreductase n=1 Tax=Streptomyces gossypii TaxID=2883101 RepID=A0ABT2JQ29_9ACTN|nr:SDR family NAD(P)-dependent oxidoreductase [Streptomyces gossypii]MCT2589982.1 SDR family NAD(P)-dependent oxidoreductase [Streptomyces gossypii]
MLTNTNTNTNSSAGSRVWFITGASRGLGRALTRAALAGGDRVIATARDVSPLAPLTAEYEGALVTFSLDVSDRAAVFAGVERAVAVFGRLDVVVNNAGGLLFGMTEEVTEAQARAHFDTNFFGALWVSQAVVPQLREQGSGHLLQMSSMGSGSGFASVALYGAGKAALDSMSEGLAMELEPFGIKVTILQPGGYATGLFTQGTTATAEREEYAQLRAKLAAMWADTVDPNPEEAAPVIREVVAMERPPNRLVLGGLAYDQVCQMAEARSEELARGEAMSRRAG